MKKLILLLFIVLTSCSKEEIDIIEETSPLLQNTVGERFTPNLISDDISSNLEWLSVNSQGVKDYNQMIVDERDGHPVLSSPKSLRFHLKPGDCGTNLPWHNDCSTDRSRAELYEDYRQTAILGQEIIYSYGMFIPKNKYLKPQGPDLDFLLILSQIYYDDPEIDGDEKGQFYLVINTNQELQIVTHEPFTYKQDKRILLEEDVYDKWLNIKISLNIKDADSGVFTVYINGVEKFTTPYDFIPEIHPDPQYFLKVGIYNSFGSRATQPYLDQVVYYDNIERTTIE